MRCLFVVLVLLWLLSSTAAFVPIYRRACVSSPLCGVIPSERVDEPADVLGGAAVRRITTLVQARSKERAEGNYEKADLLRRDILEIPIPEGYEIWIEDVPRKMGGGSNWALLRNPEDESEGSLPGSTILQLAHVALGLAVETSNQANRIRSRAISLEEANQLTSSSDDLKSKQLEVIVDQALERLKHSAVQIELGGRKAADAAFWFALAGVKEQALFERLVELSTLELERFGERASCRTKDIYQILERFAAAGVTCDAGLERAVVQSLKSKGDAVGSNSIFLDLHSERPLLLIWKFSTKQKKQRAFLQSAIRHWERQRGIQTIPEGKTAEYSSSSECWCDAFDDATRPLVVDIGCGMGVSILGLSTCTDKSNSNHLLGRMNEKELHEWKDCNFIGVDLGGLGIEYAKGVASRWGIQGRTQFFMGAAEEFVERIQQEYPGPVQLCFIQFPTPYRLQKEEPGNSQLPTSPQDGFMVTPRLLGQVSSMLSTHGRLLLQSNCEDVALWMRSAACENGFFSVIDNPAGMEQDYEIPVTSPRILPQRTRDWIAMGGARAEGPGWYMKPLLPRKGATETEVACMLNGTPVHRCLLSNRIR